MFLKRYLMIQKLMQTRFILFWDKRDIFGINLFSLSIIHKLHGVETLFVWCLLLYIVCGIWFC